MNLLFSMDQNYIPVFRNCMKSILKNGGASFYDVYILHSDLDESHQNEIRQMSGPVEFHFLQVDPDLFQGFPTSSRYPLQIYYRLAAPMLLPEEMERILYLDGDIMVINSLQSLYDMDFEDNYIVACTHTGELLNTFNQVRLGMEKPVPYINSGVMLYNLPALRDHLSIQDIQSYAASRDLLLFLPDQDILTALYGGKVKIADSRKYNLGEKVIHQNNLDPTREPIDLDWIRKNTSIIHYFGKSKPWKENYVGILDVFYDEIVKSKRLYFISGVMGVGKTTVAQELKKVLPNAVYLDGDWCWDADPFIVNDQTKEMVKKNIVYLLNSFLHADAYDNIIFTWVMDDQSLQEEILLQLDTEFAEIHSLSLICSEQELEEHLLKDISSGHRTPSILWRSQQRLEKYASLNTMKLDTTGLSVSEIAEKIVEMCEKESGL